MNKIILTGRTTADVRMTAGEKEGCTFSLAVNKYNKEVDFFNCSAWDKNAEFMEKYVTKGTLILLEGYLTTYKVGEIMKTGIVANKIEVLAYPKQKGQGE